MYILAIHYYILYKKVTIIGALPNRMFNLEKDRGKSSAKSLELSEKNLNYFSQVVTEMTITFNQMLSYYIFIHFL